MWQIRTLAKVCAYGTFGLFGVVLFAHEETQARIRKSECYIEAFKHLHENNGAVKYFGQPIKAGHANNIYDTEDASDSVYWYKVPVKGPDGRGDLYYKTVKDEKWSLSRVEVELEKLPGRRFLLMESNEPPKEEPTEGELTEKESVEGEFTEEV